MEQPIVWWKLTFLPLPLHSPKSALSATIHLRKSSPAVVGWQLWAKQESFLSSTSVFRITYFLCTYMRAHILCFEWFTTPDLWMRLITVPHSLPDTKEHRHFAEKSVPALITAFLLLLLTFSWHAASFVLWQMTLSSPFVLSTKGRSMHARSFLPSFLVSFLSLPSHN